MLVIYDKVIPPKVCDLIIEHGLEKINKQSKDQSTARTGGNGQRSKVRTIAVENLATSDNPSESYIRDTTITWFDETWIKHLFVPWIDRANEHDIKTEFDLTYTEQAQFAEYLPPKNKNETGQFYGWHQDGGRLFEDKTQRKITLISSLTDPSEYEDGELMIDMGAYRKEEERYINCKEKMSKGSILVMASDTFHMVKPISKGKRYSIVIWARGPKFK
jgi:PKHD-type hydroxylase